MILQTRKGEFFQPGSVTDMIGLFGGTIATVKM